MSDELLFDTRDGIAHVTLNRPQARNALTYAMYEGLAAYSQRIAKDDAIKVLVIRGAGDKAFAAGTDISQFLEFTSGEDGINYEERLGAHLETLERCPELLCVSSNGAGYDTIDVAACTSRGVLVVNQAGGNGSSCSRSSGAATDRIFSGS